MMTEDHKSVAEERGQQKWREGIQRQARAAYESAHGNPVSDDARGVRWALDMRVAITAAIAVAMCGAVMMWALRSPGGELVDGSTGAGTGAVTSTAEASPDASSDEWGLPAGDGPVIVDVAGHVVEPGVREMPAGSRVADAIAAAGGLLPDAATDTPNLARVLVDGEQVYVPGGDQDGGSESGGTQQPPGLVNVNRSDASALEELPGVGPVLAQRIVDFRDANGPFTSVADLDEVSGIGPSLLAQLELKATV